MAGLKSLAKDTAIYGLSSIVGRFLNYMLVPLYTAVLPASSGGYGVVSNVYAFTALMLVLLTFGMETGFFRFANKSGEDPMKVYANSLLSVGGVSMIFVLLCLLFLQPIANLLDYGNHPEFIAMMAMVVALDSFQCIPFAYLLTSRERFVRLSTKVKTMPSIFRCGNWLESVLSVALSVAECSFSGNGFLVL